MDIQHLTYFLALADTLNYTTAAGKCYISRQGMQQAIRSIEKEYGLALVINEHNHLSLTPAGTLLRAKAQEVVRSFADLDAAMHRYTAERETIKIGISRSLLPFYAPELVHRIEKYASRLPEGACHIDLLTTDEIIENLAHGRLDAALIVDVSDQGKSPAFPWQRTVLRSDTMTILLSASHPLAKKETLMLEDLSDQTILLMSDPDICFSPLSAALKEKGIPVQFHVASDYYEVGYQILRTDAVAIDREEPEIPSSSQLERSMRLENGRFTLNCSLLVPEHATGKISALQTIFMKSSLTDLKLSSTSPKSFSL